LDFSQRDKGVPRKRGFRITSRGGKGGPGRPRKGGEKNGFNPYIATNKKKGGGLKGGYAEILKRV